MPKKKPIKPSRPLLEVSPDLHGRVKEAAARAGMPLKDFTAAIIHNALLRIAGGVLAIEPQPARVVEVEGRASAS